MSIAVAIAGDRTVIKKAAEKILNTNSVQQKYGTWGMWRQGDTGSNRGDWNHLKVIHNMPKQRTGKHEVKELQQTATFGSGHKLRNVVM